MTKACAANLENHVIQVGTSAFKEGKDEATRINDMTEVNTFIKVRRRNRSVATVSCDHPDSNKKSDRLYLAREGFAIPDPPPNKMLRESTPIVDSIIRSIFYEIDCAGLGDCFFCFLAVAIAHLTGDFIMAAKSLPRGTAIGNMRLALSGWMRSNPSFSPIPHIKQDHCTHKPNAGGGGEKRTYTSTDLNSFARNASRAGTYSCVATVALMSSCLGVEIIVYADDWKDDSKLGYYLLVKPMEKRIKKRVWLRLRGGRWTWLLPPKYIQDN